MASTDSELVQRARAGDRAAFGELVTRHGGRVRRFLQTMTGDDQVAEDLGQEAVRLALERIAQLEDAGRFASWLLSIAVNRCRNHLRAEVTRRAEGGDAVESLADAGRRSALSSIVRREQAAMVALAVDRLPILLREAFVLFLVEGMPYAQIAATTGVAEGTLQVRVHRARALLRQQLGAMFDTVWSR